MMLSRIMVMRQGLRPLAIQIRRKSVIHRGIHFLFKKNLMLTNSITSGGFMAIGDLIQQEFQYQSNNKSVRYDWVRAGRMFVVGAALGWLHHYYYIYLDKLIPEVNLKTVFIKIMCDQFLAAPPTIIGFFYGMGILEGKSIQQCNSEIKEKFIFVYSGDWMFWPPVQFVNFYFLATEYRVFYINLATMLFNIFLSYTKHYDQD